MNLVLNVHFFQLQYTFIWKKKIQLLTLNFDFLFCIFKHDFLGNIVKKIRLLQSIDQRRMKEEISTKSVLGFQKTVKTIFSRGRYSIFIFSFFCFLFSNISIIYYAWYWTKLLQFGQSAQYGGGLNIYKWEWTWVKIQLCANLGKGVLRSQKRKICLFLSQSIEN